MNRPSKLSEKIIHHDQLHALVVEEDKHRMLQNQCKYTCFAELIYRLTMHAKGNILITKDTNINDCI